MTDNTPFFIVGTGRSGTTLLRLILAGHSRIHIPAETWFIMPLVAELPLTGSLSPQQVKRAVTIITTHVSSHERWPEMKVPTDEFIRAVDALHAPTLADIIAVVFHRQPERKGKVRFGDKTPRYYSILGELNALYPGAKFIYLVRDGRDVAISRLDVDWDRYYEREFQWTLAARYRRSYIDAPFAKQILDVRYEDLVADLEGTVRQVCDFLGETFEPHMLAFQQRVDLVPDREREVHRKLEGPVSDDAIAVWRTRLSPGECFAVEACLHRDLQEFGYPLRFSGAAWRPLLALSGMMLYTSAPILRRGASFLKRHNYIRRNVCV